METWRTVEKRTDVQVVAGRVTKAEVAEALGVPRRTINRHLARFGAEEPAGLRDRRHSNYRKAEAAMETVVVQAKKDGLHRGARFLRDYLEFAVSPETVRYILVKPHLERTSLPPISRSADSRRRSRMRSGRTTSRAKSAFRSSAAYSSSW